MRFLSVVNPEAKKEEQAILAIHTSNANYNSFVAEIEAHAVWCEDWKKEIPIIGESLWYESAIRADMGLDEEVESGVFDQYYNLDSKMVKEQERVHGKK